jgi:ABC-type bacteriocin/lantibiotic exporter with double-glycine peptidase domain
MVKIDKFKVRKQLKNYTCGPSALRSIFYYYNQNVSEQELVDFAEVDENGTSEKQMKIIAHKYNFTFSGHANGSLKKLTKYIERKIPILICYQDYGIANGKNGHYAILTGIDKDWVEIADPANHQDTPVAHSKRMSKENFLKRWFGDETYDDQSKLRVRRWFAIIRPKKKSK